MIAQAGCRMEENNILEDNKTTSSVLYDMCRLTQKSTLYIFFHSRPPGNKISQNGLIAHMEQMFNYLPSLSHPYQIDL